MNKILIFLLILSSTWAQENSLFKYDMNTSFSYYAEYADNEEKIISYNENLSLAPASGLKVFSSSLALAVLGEDKTFSTKLKYYGEIKNDTLFGDLIIEGEGDPVFGSDRVKGSRKLDDVLNDWVGKLKAKKIKHIAGSIYFQDNYLSDYSIPDYYPWIDIGNYYGAGSGTICVNDNLYYLYMQGGDSVGAKVKILETKPEGIPLVFVNELKSGEIGSGDNAYIYTAPGSNTAFVKGSIPAKADNFEIKGALHYPALYLRNYFGTIINKNSISIKGQKLSAKDNFKLEVLAEEISPKLKDIIYILNKKSFNLYAEMVLKHSGKKLLNNGTTDGGIEALYKFLKENSIPTEGIELFDGSGLSRANCITTKAMVKLLDYNTKQKYFNSFYNSLGIAGDTSDISFYTKYGLGTSVEKNARIKSGFIGGVRSHSGYVTGKKSGKLISFSIMTNNFKGSVRKINDLDLEFIKYLADNY